MLLAQQPGLRYHQRAQRDACGERGFDQVRAWEREYLGEEAMKKYADSVGHVPR